MAIDMIKMATAVKAAADDPGKKKQFMSNPKQYLKDQGLDIPTDAIVNYVPGSRSCGCYTVGVGGHATVGWPG